MFEVNSCLALCFLCVKSGMLMRKNVNSDVNKDSPILLTKVH